MSSTNCDRTYSRYDILSKKETDASLVLFVQDPLTNQPLVMKILRAYQDPRYLSRASPRGRRMCQVEALQWNRKFSPGIYIGLASLLKEYQENDHEIHIGEIIEDPSKVDTKANVEYVLLMRQLPEDRCLETLLDKQNEATHARLKLLTQYIAQLHTNVYLLVVPPAIGGSNVQWGSHVQLKDKLEHNIELFNLILKPDQGGHYLTYANIPGMLTHVLTHNLYRDYFEHRLREQRIRRCHGDLKLSNIWLIPADDDETREHVLLLDAIDFNPVYSNIDILSDFAMLVVDVQAHTKSSVIVGEMIEYYLQLTHQEGEINRSVLNYYLAEKAMMYAAISIIYDRSSLGPTYLEVAQSHINELKRRLDR
jgi:aminoglycoside phosphotransferase family enzyme